MFIILFIIFECLFINQKQLLLKTKDQPVLVFMTDMKQQICILLVKVLVFLTVEFLWF